MTNTYTPRGRDCTGCANVTKDCNLEFSKMQVIRTFVCSRTGTRNNMVKCDEWRAAKVVCY